MAGNRVKLNDEYRLAHALFSGIEEQLSYSQTFKHPTFNQPGSYKEELDENFIPLYSMSKMKSFLMFIIISGIVL